MKTAVLSIIMLFVAMRVHAAETNYATATAYHIYHNITTNLESVANQWSITVLPDGTVKQRWKFPGHPKQTLAQLRAIYHLAVPWFAAHNKAEENSPKKMPPALLRSLRVQWKDSTAIRTRLGMPTFTWKKYLQKINEEP